MKIAVTAQGPTLESDVDPRFGRTQCFIVIDTDKGTHRVVDNAQNLQAAQGAGIQAAQTMVDQSVEAVLTGNCGPKAFKVLGAARIAVHVGVKGTVAEAVAEFTAGSLPTAAAPNVEGHWS
ncbi:MAG: dinitrogenase iron-molybdenum cofactor biosynthesis protein [bacterium]|nr:dinitrogenase iron-molybdenum cofactor biosynthesis protein [bacterium]